MASYEAVRVHRAFSDTRRFWSTHQILSSIMPGVIGLALPYLLKAAGWKLEGIFDQKTAILAGICAVAACALSWVVSFVVNYVWLSPAAIWRERQEQIEALTPPPSDPLIEQKMADFTLEEAGAIETLLRHGETLRKDVPALGVPLELFYRAIEKGKRCLLVTERDLRTSEAVHQWLRINPTLEPGLKDYFAKQKGRPGV